MNSSNNFTNTFVLQPVMAENSANLHDTVALEAFRQLGTNNAGENFHHLGVEMTKHIINLQAKLAWDFADAFMRERYERHCVKATGIDLNELMKKSNV